MKLSRFGWSLVLGAWLCTAAWADVFVKNKPFKGATSGSAGAVMVEAEPMLKALGVEGYKLEGNQLTIGEKTLLLEGGLVSLKELSEAAGAKMVVNASMGTVDVYQGGDQAAEVAPAGKAPKAAGSTASWGAGSWHTSWDAAAAEARTSNKPILINFTGSDWCGWCMRLKKEVFDTDYFKGWAAQKVVLLEVDFPRGKPQSAQVKEANQQLARKYGVRGYPTILFANAAGQPLGQYGYAEGGPQVWTQQAEKLMKKR
jgi:protein disulfide-isomerase